MSQTRALNVNTDLVLSLLIGLLIVGAFLGGAFR